MTTEKQLLANQQNAQLSTGPITISGKGAIATNAIKHGIFTKDLILSSELENENVNDYQELLYNLVDSLEPCNQMENLLVEKIAVDFWRLRRTIRFETGSIAKNIQSLLKELYCHGRKNNQEINDEIRDKEDQLQWNLAYMGQLLKGNVTFDQPEWQGETITSDIVEDFYMLTKEFPNLSKEQRERLYYTGDFTFDELQVLLKKNGYSQPEVITERLLELYAKQNLRLEQDIRLLKESWVSNNEANVLLNMLGMIPQADSADKVLKYERGLQKSIYQNLIMLKKLQGLF